MKWLWAKSNIWILTAAGVAVAAYMALAWDAMPAGQRALGFFVVGIVAHEWEEMRFPGGFYDLMTRKFGIEGCRVRRSWSSAGRRSRWSCTATMSSASTRGGMRSTCGAGCRRRTCIWSWGIGCR